MSKKVWVADDVFTGEGEMGVDLKRVGKEIGVEFEFFKTAEAVIEKLIVEQPDLILMDETFDYSRLQGSEAVKKIKNLYADIPIIKISGNPRVEVGEADGKIFKMYLAKDFADEDGLIRKFLFEKK